MIPAYAQRDGQGDKRGGQRDREQGKQDKGSSDQRAPKAEQQQRQQPQQVQRQAQPPQQQQRVQTQQQRSEQSRGKQQPRRSEQQARTWQQQRGWSPPKSGAWQGNSTWQHTRANRWSSDHRTWAQRGGYGGYYIPQDRFSLSFGSSNFFRIPSRPVMYLGYPRFEYSGFSFLMLDPWPEYWSDNWYDSSDVYIDYDDGYYLYNRSYPQVRLAITIAL